MRDEGMVMNHSVPEQGLWNHAVLLPSTLISWPSSLSNSGKLLDLSEPQFPPS